MVVSLNSGEIYGDHGILTHFTPLNVTQGVVRNRKAIFNVPLSFEVIVDPKKMQTDVTIVNPKGSCNSNTRSWNNIF
jgi:hypothetical protein